MTTKNEIQKIFETVQNTLDRKRVAFLPNIVTHLFVMKPVIEYMKQHDTDVIVFRYEVGLRNWMGDDMKKENIEYKDINSHDFLFRLANPIRKKRFNKKFVDAALKAIKQERADALIICDFTSDLMQPLICKVKEAGIPILAMQWGNLDDWWKNTENPPCLPDRIALFSELDKELLWDKFKELNWV
jgi:hypothetical protein